MAILSVMKVLQVDIVVPVRNEERDLDERLTKGDVDPRSGLRRIRGRRALRELVQLIDELRHGLRCQFSHGADDTALAARRRARQIAWPLN